MSTDAHRNALEAARAGDLDAAHSIVQHEPDRFSARIHAWLHRAEGDLENARYWYARAGVPVPELLIDDELEVLVQRDTDRWPHAGAP